MGSIDDYAAEQEAMTRMRAKSVAAEFSAVAGDRWTRRQLDSLVGSIDLSRFVTGGGDVDTSAVKNLLRSLDSVAHAPTAGTRSVRQVVADRREARAGAGGTR